jgi:hypothetical protein
VERDWLQDERLEEFDERVHGLNRDCADAVPLPAEPVQRPCPMERLGLTTPVAEVAADGQGLLQVPGRRPSQVTISRPWKASSGSPASLAAGIAVSEVRARQASRGVRSGIAPSVIRKNWDAAEIYPQARNPMLRPTPEQMQMLRMFQPVPTHAGATELPDLLVARLKALSQGEAA